MIEIQTIFFFPSYFFNIDKTLTREYINSNFYAEIRKLYEDKEIKQMFETPSVSKEKDFLIVQNNECGDQPFTSILDTL